MMSMTTALLGKDLDPASRRILRMALGTALAMWFCQAVGWTMSFICPVFAVVILSLPIPAPSFGGGVKFVAALSLSVYAGLALLPFLEYHRGVGTLLFSLALFHSFYYVARGGSPILGMFMTVGLTMVAAIGSVSIDALVGVAKGMTVGGFAGMGFVWLAHAILPDPPPDPSAAQKRPTPPPPPDARVAARIALRSTMIVLPLAIWFLFSASSATYAVIMIKVATMGPQAEAEKRREMGRSFIGSTVIGGVAAIVIWNILRIWPSLTLYSLLIGLMCLIMGPKIFAGRSLASNGSTWSYGLLTALIIIAPAVTDSMGGDTASASFSVRLSLFVFIAIYGTVVVRVFDAFWPDVQRRAEALA